MVKAKNIKGENESNVIAKTFVKLDVQPILIFFHKKKSRTIISHL